MRRNLVIILLGVIVICTSVNSISSFKGNSEENKLSVWYWNDGEYNAIRDYLLRDILIFSNSNGFDLEHRAFDESMMTYDEYLKRLSIGLSTGQCDLTLSPLKVLDAYSNSLLTLDDVNKYQDIMPNFQFEKYIPVEYIQPTLGINQYVFDDLGVEYHDGIDMYDYFELKKKWRKSGNVMVLDYYEVSEIVDEVLLAEEDIIDVSKLDIEKVYEDYIEMMNIVNSGAYDYSELELHENFIDVWGRREENRPFFTKYSGFESNLLTHGLRFTRAPYFKMFTDTRLGYIATENFDRLGVGISAYSQNKSECKKILDKILDEKVQNFVYKQGFASIKGYDAIKLKTFNSLLPSFQIEKNAYLSAEQGDERFDFKRISSSDLMFRSYLTSEVIATVRSHTIKDEYQFIESCENEVMKILIETGER